MSGWMFRQATKDHGEREDEAAEHLVRPAPKKKPPRWDLRREHVEEATSDPDLKSDLGVESDPDMSLNRKRTAVRHAMRRRGLSKDDRIPAVNRDGVIVQVTEHSMREHPGEYKKLSPEEAEKAKAESKAKGEDSKEKSTQPAGSQDSTPANLGLKKAPGDYGGGLLSVYNHRTNRVEYHNSEAISDNPGVLTPTHGPVPRGAHPGQSKPKSQQPPAQQPPAQQPPAPVQGTPAVPSPALAAPTPEQPSEAVPGAATPQAPQTQPAQQPAQQPPAPENPWGPTAPAKGEEPLDVEDLWKEDPEPPEKNVKVLNTLAKSDPDIKKLLKDLGNPKSKLLQSLKGDLSKLPASKAFPELEDLKDDPNIKSAKDVIDVARHLYSVEPPKSKGKGDKHKADRKVSIDERLEIERRVFDSMPTEMANDLLLQGLHPDDLAHIVDEYEQSEKMDPKERRAHVRKAMKEGVHFDTSTVTAPDSYNGTPWNKLSPEDQAEAMADTRRSALARSYIAREFVSEDLHEAGIPADLSYSIAEIHLGTVPPDQQDSVTSKIAEKVFDRAVTSGGLAHSKGRDKLISIAKKDPNVAKIVTNYLQASDYNEAKRKFAPSLDERSPAYVIQNSITSAQKFLKDRAKGYPSQDTDHDMPRAYKLRVLSRLKTLDPDKYREVHEGMALHEAREFRPLIREHMGQLKKYESDLKDWTAKKNDFDTKLKAHKDAHKEWRDAGAPEGVTLPPKPHVRVGPPPREPQFGIPPPGLTDEARKQWEEAHKKHTEQLKSLSKSYEELAPKELALASEEDDVREVSDRLKRKPEKQAGVFTYAVRKAMSNARRSVYHGIDPYPNPPEKSEWTQARRQELTASDLKTILAEARTWLSSGPLSWGFDGVPRDAQLRAALDLGIRQAGGGRYSEGVPPDEYESMFRQLAGVQAEGTLLTVQSSYISTGTSPNGDHDTMSMPKFAAEQANNLLTRLDRVAGLIQENHQKWGMPFRAAKEIVNALDKTADEIELASFGRESLLKRQAEVIQRDQDESYMDTFSNPMKPIQTDGDEKFMAAYGDDQSSAVDNGKSTTGRPLAP